MKKDNNDNNKLTWNKKSLKVLQDSLLDQVSGAGTQVCAHAGYTEWDTSCSEHQM